MVADRGYRAPKSKKPGPPRKPPAAVARRARAAPRRNRPPASLVMRFVQLIWRIIWGATWRAGAAVALVLALSVSYFYTTLPPLTALLDARTRGSVTLLDNAGQVFAWRGETFGGQITSENVAPALLRHRAQNGSERDRIRAGLLAGIIHRRLFRPHPEVEEKRPLTDEEIMVR